MQQALFEARYISLKWFDADQVEKVTVSPFELVPEQEGQDRYSLDLVSYSKLPNGHAGQLGIRLRDKHSDIVPRFELTDGSAQNLKSVTDPDSGVQWWIEAGSWNGQQKRYDSELCRASGQASLRVAQQLCQLNIELSERDKGELEYYLRDFRLGFWELILKQDSLVSGSGCAGAGFSIPPELPGMLGKLVEHARQVLEKPRRILKETVQSTPRAKVRPVVATFQRLLQLPESLILPGKGHIEQVNLPENRYVHSVISQLIKLVDAQVQVSGAMQEAVQQYCADEQQRLASFKDYVEINPELAKRELADMERELAQKIAAAHYQGPLRGWQPDDAEWYFQVEGIFGGNKSPTGYFVKVWSQQRQQWRKPDKQVGFCVLTGCVNQQLMLGCAYRMIGDIKYHQSPSGSDTAKTRFNYHVESLAEAQYLGGLELDQEKLDQQKDALIRLSADQWRRPLSQEERRQQQREKDAIQKQQQTLQGYQQAARQGAQQLSRLLVELKQVSGQFKARGIGKQKAFPASMSFANNPDYLGVHRGYKQILALIDTHESVDLEVIFAFQKIGLTGIAQIYERWCLVQMFRVLIDKFRFTPEQGWKEKLVQQVLNNQFNVAVQLDNPAIAVSVILTYECVLENGKRPDFVLDIRFFDQQGRLQGERRFVLDAKFKSWHQLEQAMNMLGLLSHQKGYQRQGNNPAANSLFVLHPNRGLAGNKVSPQAWGGNDYLGEYPLSGETAPNHHWGAVALSPVNNSRYLDDLQRLIGMFIQYGCGVNKDMKFCIACGGTDLHVGPSPKNVNVDWVTCNSCRHFTAYSYCQSCKGDILKNGSYWTYHKVKATEPLNMACPTCMWML